MNKYKFEEINEIAYSKYAQNNKYNHIFQTVAWAKVKANWSHCYLAVIKDDEIVAATLVLMRNIKFGYKFAYIPKGPLIDFYNKELMEFFFSHLKVYLKNKHVVLAKLDPNIKLASIDFDKQDEVEKIKDELLINKFRECGLIYNGYVLKINQSIQPRIQLGFPIDNDIALIEERIGRKTMKKVRASFRKGVELKYDDNVVNLANIINYTEQRHHIHLRNEQYFAAILNNFKDDATVLTAYVDGIAISSCLLVKSKDQAEILYSGYNDEYKKYNSTYPMRYQAILWAYQHQCKCFNFGGVEGSLDDGLSMFKSAFRPLIDVYIGEFDLLMMPIVSKTISKLFYRLKHLVNI